MIDQSESHILESCYNFAYCSIVAQNRFVTSLIFIFTVYILNSYVSMCILSCLAVAFPLSLKCGLSKPHVLLELPRFDKIRTLTSLLIEMYMQMLKGTSLGLNCCPFDD